MKSIATVIISITLGLGAFGARAADGEGRPRQAPPIPDWAKQFDKNGDGKLDPQESQVALKSRREEMMKKYDKNGDGKLDPDEQKSMNEERRKEREEAAAKRKTELDKKKDGSKDEKKEEKKDEKKEDEKKEDEKKEEKPAESAAASASAAPTAAAAPTAKPASTGGTKSPGTTPSTPKEPKEPKAATPKPEEMPAQGSAPFSVSAAQVALTQAAGNAASCAKPGGPTGSGKVQVTFATSGRVTTANVAGPPFGGTPVGGCVAGVFRKARIPAFAGNPVTVSKSFAIH